MHRSMVDYSTADVKIVKHRALRAAFRGDDSVMKCSTYIDTHAGAGTHNNCPGSPMIASDQFNFSELLLYENDPKKHAQLAKSMDVSSIVRHADGFNSHHYSNNKTFVFMDPPFESIKDYFKVANYLQAAPGIGSLMLMYPVNKAFPIEDFHTMLQRQIGGVNFLVERAKSSITKHYCMFSSDVSVIPEWQEILNHSQLVSDYCMQEHIGDYLFEKRRHSR